MTDDRRTGRSVSGLGLAVVSASSFGLSGPLGRGVMDVGWSAAAAVTVRMLVAAAVLAPIAVVQMRGRWRGLRRHLPLIGVYAAIPVAGCQLAFFNAVARMPVGVALLIEYTAPLAVVGWLWLRHRQRPGRGTVVGALVGTAGLMLVLDLTAGTPTSPVGVAWAFAAMLGAAFYFVLSSREPEGLPPTALAAGALLVGGVLLLIAGATGLVPFTVTTAPVAFVGNTVPWWLLVAGLGIVTAGVAYASGIAATRRLGARLASFVALSEVLAAVVFAWLLLGEVPSLTQLVGGVLILAGVVAVRLGEPTAVVGTAEAARVTVVRPPAGPARR